MKDDLAELHGKTAACLAEVDAVLLRLWLAAGGLPQSHAVTEREVTVLVRQLAMLAAAVPNPLGTLRDLTERDNAPH